MLFEMNLPAILAGKIHFFYFTRLGKGECTRQDKKQHTPGKEFKIREMEVML